jgi:hypothetical protein
MSDTGYLGHSQAEWDALAKNGPYVDPADPLGWGAIAKSMAPSAPVTTPAKEDNSAMLETYSLVAKKLEESGLGALFNLVDGMPDPNSWLYKQIVNNPGTNFDALGPAIEETDVYKARFPGIVKMRQQNLANAGDLNKQVLVPSPAVALQYEKDVRALFAHAGLPESMQGNGYIQDLMSKGMSPPEIEMRLGQAYTRVNDTDPAVRDAYSSFYGPIEGAGVLAASFLDPAHVMSELDRRSMASYTSGMGRTLGLDINKNTAEAIANIGKTDAGVMQDLQTVSRQSGLYSESIGEATDLTAQTGLEAVALGNAAASSALERRQIERQANARTSVGGAASTNQGLTGLGTS